MFQWNTCNWQTLASIVQSLDLSKRLLIMICDNDFQSTHNTDQTAFDLIKTSAPKSNNLSKFNEITEIFALVIIIFNIQKETSP